MKKSNYITKYDYINYYTKQPKMWFFTNAEIKASYDEQLEEFTSNKKIIDLWDEEDDFEDDEIDSYERYRELLEENRKIDKDNPLLISGNIIDKESKSFIIQSTKNKYPDGSFIVLDFDDEGFNLEKNHEKTISTIKNNDFVIMFQPVFINSSNNTLTKCDAIVKYYNEIFLIETKATSTAKYVHLLDLLFQKKVIENELNINKYHITYELCLIRYEKLPKNYVSFIVSDTINLLKSIAIPKGVEDMYTKQQIKIGAEHTRVTPKGKIVNGENLFINDVLDFSEDFLSHPKTKVSKGKKKNEIESLLSNFNDVINELWEHKKNLEQLDKEKIENNEILKPQDFLPHSNDKSIYKNTDLWLDLRYLYFQKGFDFFKYSGNVLNQSTDNLEKITQLFSNGDSINLEEYIRFSEDTKKDLKELFFSTNSKDFFIVENKYKQYMNMLKKNLVYFDFETINPPIRVIDDSLPFAQIVTQCSILKEQNNIVNEHCVNLMCDPLKITKDFFKQIVDELYEGEEYSYVVYNKTFEENRLKEFINYINEEEYTKKINIINNNLFDLADFFRVSKENKIIFIKELGGFYSIKKILPLVEKYHKDIFQQTKCVDYHELNIYNGLVCQTKSLKRFFNLISDEEWNQIELDSKKYCENDVRAMVAVLQFIFKLYESSTIPHC